MEIGKLTRGRVIDVLSTIIVASQTTNNRRQSCVKQKIGRFVVPALADLLERQVLSSIHLHRVPSYLESYSESYSYVG